jgi:hypothetical protein
MIKNTYSAKRRTSEGKEIPGGQATYLPHDKNENCIEQSVPGYGPQIIALRWPPHAANIILYACGPILTRDVGEEMR